MDNTMSMSSITNSLEEKMHIHSYYDHEDASRIINTDNNYYYLTTHEYENDKKDILIYITDHEKLCNKIYGEKNYYIGTLYNNFENSLKNNTNSKFVNTISFNQTQPVDNIEEVIINNTLSVIKVHNIEHRNLSLQKGKDYGGTFLSLLSGKEFVLEFNP
jgi:hypothetical protein